MQIGLTGGIASGKSLVAAQFRNLGAPSLSADELAHDLLLPGGAAYQETIAAFGIGICDEQLQIDRTKLGNLVFRRQELLERLNRIMHPKILAAFSLRATELSQQFPYRPLICEVPLLFEAKLQRLFSKIIVVFIPLNLQLTRLIARDGLTVEQANNRLAAQMPLSAKVASADYVIDNSTTEDQTFQQVKAIYAELLVQSRRPPGGDA